MNQIVTNENKIIQNSTNYNNIQNGKKLKLFLKKVVKELLTIK